MSLPRAEALTHTQVEAIVRAVLQRLLSGTSAAGVRDSAGVVRLDLRLVALEHLRDHWNALRILQVPVGCVLTPAVQDELRQRRVVLERFAPAAAADTPTGPIADKLLVLAAADQHAALTRQLAGNQAQLKSLAGDDTAAGLAELRQHLLDGDRRAVWCTPRPFAAMAQISSELKTTAIHLPALDDLPRAIEQAQPKLIVVDSTRWHAAAICQLVRHWNRRFRTS